MNRLSLVAALAACCLSLPLGPAVFAQEVKLPSARPKMTTASAVRARAEPQTAAQEVARLKLGSVVNAVARTAEQVEVGGRRDYWFRVELPGGGSAWVFGALLADYDAARRAELVRRVVEERLKVETMSFDDGVDFYNFVEGALADTKQPAARGELELARLHALGRAVRSMPESAGERPPFRDFHRAHEREIYHHELAGVWAVRPEVFWELERKYRGTPLGDRIAWDAAQALRGGECESDEVCQFLSLHDTEGKYLSLYPRGTRAREVLENLARALDSEQLAATLNSRGGDRYAAEARGALRKALAELRASLARVPAGEKAAVLGRLNKLSPARP
ncbi:MAG TPA: SH3 domain-containing protein [Pyrinomonadaceae bacterium]|nr:SH3 domain-containing protein [Pyrinomonadaceae bacterium]